MVVVVVVATVVVVVAMVVVVVATVVVVVGRVVVVVATVVVVVGRVVVVDATVVLVDATVVLVDATTVVLVDPTVVLVVATLVVVVGRVVVVVVDLGTVVVVVPPPAQLPDTHASQQLGCVPTQALPPCGALHAPGLFMMLHFVVPPASVRQHVTAPGFPQVELAAQFMTASAHRPLSVPARTAWPALSDHVLSELTRP